MLQRKEIRYIVSLSAIEDFIKEINKIAKEEVFSTPYNWTIYFNNSEHEVPFEVSIKGRKYSNQPFHGSLNLDEKWIFEIKEDYINKNCRFRRKKRKVLTLEEILNTLSEMTNIKTNQITSPLRPYLLDSYRRRHFLLDENIRITIDTDLTYYLFEDTFNGKQIGNENYARIEIKIRSEKINSTKFHKIDSLLKDLEAEETISKKDMAYNLLSNYLRKKSGRKVATGDVEIEAKLLLSRDEQYIFHKIKRDFYYGLIKGFTLLDNFPYTLEGGKLHKYLVTSKDEFFRVGIKGKSKTIIQKEGFKVVDDPYGLKCIIKRKEIRRPFDSNIDLSKLQFKTIYRKRKYFLVENEKDKKTYCILIDRCTHEASELFQMEIEGLLDSPLKNEEREIIRDIGYLTCCLITKYPVLKPTTLTKLEWLRKI